MTYGLPITGAASGKLLAVIPARGGSKRIPGKNIRPMAGQPLIEYTIEAALGSGIFDRVVVSTDSPQIAAIARAAGADVPFLRETALADDHTPVSVATADMLERLGSSSSVFDSVAQLMPNCPLRTSADIVDSYRSFAESGFSSQISVCRYGWLNPWWAITRDEGDALVPVFEQRHAERSQDQPDVFCPTGAVWWVRAATLRAERTFHIARRTGWELPWERAVDIDDEDDWRMAEVLMSMRRSG